MSTVMWQFWFLVSLAISGTLLVILPDIWYAVRQLSENKTSWWWLCYLIPANLAFFGLCAAIAFFWYMSDHPTNILD